MLHVLLFILTALGAAAKSCRSFSVNSTSAQFDYYRFYDFRNLTAGAIDDLPRRNHFPRILSVNDSDWSHDWDIREQNKRPPSDDTIHMSYVKENIWIGMP
jgi:hypothetical protein